MSHMKMRTCLEQALVAVAYVVAGALSPRVSTEAGLMAPVWAPAGVMIALVFIRGLQIWPGIVAGALVTQLLWAIPLFSQSGHSPLLPVVLHALTDAGGILFSVILMSRVGSSRLLLGNFRVFIHFLLICVLVGPGLASGVALTALAAGGLVPEMSQVPMLLVHWTGTAVGVLFLTPLILAFSGHCRFVVHDWKPRELLLYGLACTVVLAAVVMHDAWPALLPSPLYAVIPLLLWSALRLDIRFNVATLLVFGILARYLTLARVGPFYDLAQPLYVSLLATELFMVLLAVCIHAVGIVVQERDRYLARLTRQYNHDPLTGALTRPPLQQKLKNELQRFERYGDSFSLVMFDLDRFKAVNDDLGHEAGDRVLREAVGMISAQLRGPDILARWGGEEFMVLLPNTGLDGAKVFAERCRAAVEAHDFGIDRKVTVSLGLCEMAPGRGINDMLRCADHAMYEAKAKGRNRVVASRCTADVAKYEPRRGTSIA